MAWHSHFSRLYEGNGVDWLETVTSVYLGDMEVDWLDTVTSVVYMGGGGGGGVWGLTGLTQSLQSFILGYGA